MTHRSAPPGGAVLLLSSLLASVACHSHSAGNVVAPSEAASGPYYVATNGSDQNQGTTTSPWRTISYAVTRLKPGDTLFVRGGVYNDWLDNPVVSGTSWASPVRIAAYQGESVWLKPSGGSYAIELASSQQYIEFDGINIDARYNSLGAPVRIEGWSGGNAHHIRIKNAEIISGGDGIPNQGTSGGATAIMVTAAIPGVVGGNEFQHLVIHGGGDPGDFAYAFYVQSSDNLIEQCDISDTSGGGIQIYNGYGWRPSNNIVRGNRIHDIRRSGDNRIWGIIDAADGTQIQNNTIFNVGTPASVGAAIDLYYGSGAVVEGNTVYGNHPFGIFIESGARSAIITNNTIYDNDTNVHNLSADTSVVGDSVPIRR